MAWQNNSLAPKKTGAGLFPLPYLLHNVLGAGPRHGRLLQKSLYAHFIVLTVSSVDIALGNHLSEMFKTHHAPSSRLHLGIH